MPNTKTYKGVSIYYECKGSGTSLVLISGTGHDLNFWSAQLPHFSPEFQTITFDNRGVGKSSTPKIGYSLADMASDIIHLLDELKIDKAHIMGFSMGGHIAQELAINYPDRIISLGIHHSWARAGARLKSFQETRLYLAQNNQREALTELSMLALHSSAYYDEHPLEMRNHREFLLHKSPLNDGWVGQLSACIKGDTLDRINKIKVPTLITCSELDVIAPPHLSLMIHNRIQESELNVMKNTGHVALMEAPEEFSSICLNFLKKLG